jgi:hypothetical protein
VTECILITNGIEMHSLSAADNLYTWVINYAHPRSTLTIVDMIGTVHAVSIKHCFHCPVVCTVPAEFWSSSFGMVECPFLTETVIIFIGADYVVVTILDKSGDVNAN